jgi:transcriptional regulator with XRE-family HTH domain
MEPTTQTRRPMSIRPDRLLEARFNCALTQEETAALIKCSPRAYQRWENGQASPQPRYVRELSEKLNVSVPWLRGLN